MKKLYIGIDIGGTRTKIGLVDLIDGLVLDTMLLPTEKRDACVFLHMIESAIGNFKRKTAEQNTIIAGVGFGVPGFVFQNGVVDSTYGFLEFMEDFPLVELIENKNSIPCRVDNDARVVALGEALYGKGKDYSRVLVLTLGTGLGIGFVVNGKFESSLPYEHMGGHITISETNIKCYCGKTGCLEALVSGSAIINAANRLNWPKKHPHLPLTVETIFKAEQEGNTDALIIVEEFLLYLKKGIDNYINLFAPDILIIGGGIAKGMNAYLSRLENPAILKPYKKYKVEIAISALEETSGILGAGALFYT